MSKQSNFKHSIAWGTHAHKTAFVAIMGLLGTQSATAVDFGPFTLTGFAKLEVTSSSNQCTDCQRFSSEGRHRLWADQTIPGAEYGTETKHVSLFQPFLGANFDLGQGVKLSGLLSQRWRDGKVDIDGYWYDKNIALSHEEWGSVRVGSMTTRAWSLSDYPYGTDIGVADVWGSSGAGYGLLSKAVRYTTRPLDVANGDLVLEATYDQGNTDFKKNKPKFLEIWAQYKKGDLMLDGVYQDTRNGTPMAWGHGPFTGLTPFAQDDALLGGSGQSIAMVMARYDLTSQVKLYGGWRHNRWSGAYAVITKPGTSALWNDMFNVDWNGTRDGVANPGYAATSTDLSLGARYKVGDVAYSVGMTHLGKAKTDNPSERGQSNSMTLLTTGVNRDMGQGLQVYAMLGYVQYAKKGLAPLSMPSNAAFTGVDPRATKSGNWAGAGLVYTF